MTESELQSKIIKHLTERGHYTVKIVAANRKGVPDVLACINGKFIGIEVKAPKKYATELQKLNLRQICDADGIGFETNNFEHFITVYNKIIRI